MGLLQYKQHRERSQGLRMPVSFLWDVRDLPEEGSIFQTRVLGSKESLRPSGESALELCHLLGQRLTPQSQGKRPSAPVSHGHPREEAWGRQALQPKKTQKEEGSLVSTNGGMPKTYCSNDLRPGAFWGGAELKLHRASICL